MVSQTTQVRRYEHLVGGGWLDPSSVEVIARINPATGEKVAEFAAGNPEDTHTEFGLANSLWTKDLDKAMTVSMDLQAGRIWVNTTIDGGPQLPAGGYKASGFGREMGYTGLEEFTEIKSVLYRLGKREPFFGSDWSR
jgi:acyl-CoA reductase-like NAD-dependent aldehyde dehydrogenase